jgi:hypothetical protein
MSDSPAGQGGVGLGQHRAHAGALAAHHRQVAAQLHQPADDRGPKQRRLGDPPHVPAQAGQEPRVGGRLVVGHHHVGPAIDVGRRRALDAEPPLRRDPGRDPAEPPHPAPPPTQVAAIEQRDHPEHWQPGDEDEREAHVGEHAEERATHGLAL